MANVNKDAANNQYRFKKNSGFAKQKELIRFARYVGKQLNFEVTAEGLDIKETNRGVHLRGLGSGEETTCPFSAEVYTDPDTTLRYIRFTTAGQILPWGIPSNMVDTVNDRLVYIGISSSTFGFIVADIEADEEGNILDVALDFVTNEPSPIPVAENHPPTSFSVPILMLIGDSIHRLIGCGNLALLPQLVFSVDKEEYECGESPYKRYYTWVVSSV